MKTNYLTTDPTNCKDILDANPGKNLPSQPYKIYIGGKEVTAYCDMKTDGGGWTVSLFLMMKFLKLTKKMCNDKSINIISITKMKN